MTPNSAVYAIETEEQGATYALTLVPETAGKPVRVVHVVGYDAARRIANALESAFGQIFTVRPINSEDNHNE